MNVMKQQFLLKALIFLVYHNTATSLVIRKRQSDLFTSNNFDASLVSNPGNTGGMAPNEDSNGGMTGSGGSFGGGNIDRMGGGINPFKGNNNGGDNSVGSFGGGSNGNSMGPFSGGANGNSMGQFSGGGANGNSMGPFTGGANGNAGPFSGGANGNAMGPFSGAAKGEGSKNPFSIVKGNSINFSVLFPLDTKYSGVGMKSPFESNNLKGGPGGMTGGMFNIDMGTSDGPGGLNGSPFMSNNIDSGGPGALSGGSFLDKTGSSNGLSGIDSKFDTSQYEEMLRQMFTTDSDKGDGNPFDPNSYSKEIKNAAGTGRINSGGSRQQYNSASSYESGDETSDPFSTKHFKDSKSPFKVHQTYQIGSGTNSDQYGTSYNNGLKSNSYQSNNDNTDTYQTPFDKDTNYNDLLSSPFQSSSSNSRVSGQGYNDQSVGTAYTPFKADRGVPGMAGMNNPGGNPFNQAGSQIGRG